MTVGDQARGAARNGGELSYELRMADGASGKVLATGMSDSELSFLLLLMHGVQWIMGTKGDPYALLLRGASDDPHDLGRRMGRRSPPYRSHAATWVTAHHELAVAALLDPRMSPEHVAPRESDDLRAREERILLYELSPGPAAREPQLLPPGKKSSRRSKSIPSARSRPVQRPTIRSWTRSRATSSRTDPVSRREPLVSGSVQGEGNLVERQELFQSRQPTANALDVTLCPPQLATARRRTRRLTAIRPCTTTRTVSAWIDRSTRAGPCSPTDR